MINIRSLDPKESVIAVILLFMLMILLSTISDSTCCFLATGRDGLCELETTFSGMGVNY